MNSPRYEELLGRMLEGDLSGREAEEFAAELRANPARLRDLRRHLVLWEIWSQHQAPERSSEAFVNAWKTRLRAETEGADVFPDSVRAQIEARQPPPGVIEFFRRFIAARRPVRMAWAASLLIAGLALVVWFAAPRSAHSRPETSSWRCRRSSGRPTLSSPGALHHSAGPSPSPRPSSPSWRR